MASILKTILVSLLLLLIACCNQSKQETKGPASAPAPQQAKEIQKPAPPPEEFQVTIQRKAAKFEIFHVRVVRASSPFRVKLSSPMSPGSLGSAATGHEEAAPNGMKWMIVIVELETTQGELSIPMNRIRLMDETKTKCRLISIGKDEVTPFTDFREYDKYRQVEPPELVIGAAGKTTKTTVALLFAVSSGAKSFVLEL